MGVTIHYRGTIDRFELVEPMEDRITDLVFALGGRATIWRSFADHNPSRVVRGVMLEMVPGQETMSLLISPEGHLIPLHQIGEAEMGPQLEPPDCWVKTQFGSIQGHIAIVHLLDALKQAYCGNLEIRDEGGYYEDRDVGRLADRMHRLGQAIRALGESLQEFGLTNEAAEDPSILASRIERVAALVHRKLIEDSDKSADIALDPDPESEDWHEPTLEDEVASMDAIRLKNELRGERMNRRIRECMAKGMPSREAFDLAIREELPQDSAGESDQRGESSGFDEEDYDDETSEPDWQSEPFDEWNEMERGEQHPEVVEAQRFLHEVMKLAGREAMPDPFLDALCRGAMEMVGGLVQATYRELDNPIARALAITQLKRALKGHAFSRGAVFGLRARDSIDKVHADRMFGQLKEILDAIHRLSSLAWDETSP